MFLYSFIARGWSNIIVVVLFCLLYIHSIRIKSKEILQEITKLFFAYYELAKNKKKHNHDNTDSNKKKNGKYNWHGNKTKSNNNNNNNGMETNLRWTSYRGCTIVANNIAVRI